MAESVEVSCFVCCDGTTGEQSEMVTVLCLPNSSLQTCSLGVVGYGGVENQLGDFSRIVDGASVDRSVGGEDGVGVERLVVDVVIEVDAVDCTEVNGLAADDGRRRGKVSAGSGVVITIEDEGHGLAGISKSERVSVS